MKEKKKKYRRIFCIALLATVVLSGCGHVKSAKKLIRQAKRDHGACEVISKKETEESTEVVLKDKLQGFEYTVRSYMSDINIDGASFGSLPEQRDGFETALIDYVLSETQTDVETVCQKYGAVFDNEYALSLTIPKGADAKTIGEEVAAYLYAYNKNNRMDDFRLSIRDDEDSPLGSCYLSDGLYRTPQEEQIDDYRDYAKRLLQETDNRGGEVTFVKKESGTFAETGLPLPRVANVLGSTFPKTMSDPVIFFYFKTDHQEFYIADFVDNDTDTWYTTFDPEKEKGRKKSPIHISFHIGSIR
ncbi:MAG: hypothetical protein IK078_05255 [Lachnospiraceae bacterium]|nr:hypothetical protein [Lachnospiraceae bacterium]